MKESWDKLWCPACNEPNWICLGDMEDYTVPDIEAVECHKCFKKWMIVEPEHCCWFDEDDADHRVNPEMHAYTEKGRPTP